MARKQHFPSRVVPLARTNPKALSAKQLGRAENDWNPYCAAHYREDHGITCGWLPPKTPLHRQR